jgi:hypothetical protein
MQLPSPAVVAQPFPGLQDSSLVSRCQVSHGGKPFKEATEEIFDPLNLGLLQHDLTDPDRIRIT